jgi:hypothetical protein
LLWVSEGYSIRQLCDQSGISSRSLWKSVQQRLSEPPPDRVDSLSQHRHLLIDGTFLTRNASIIALMDGESATIIDGCYDVRENATEEVRRFLLPLITRGLNPVSCTVDGNPQVIRLLRELWPRIKLQRCLVHIQRQGLRWCRRNPKRIDARKLAELFTTVITIDSEAKRDAFIKKVQQWEKRYGQAVAAPTGGWVASDLRSARSMLLKALPDMFHYLEEPKIPISTNALEGYFSRLKAKYRNHRGLSELKRFNYFKWYFNTAPK